MRAFIVMLAFPLGCGGGLELTLVEAAHRRPSNVAVYFAVDDASGEPVGGLAATDFRIYEDGSLVSVHESKQTIVNPEVAVEHTTLLLVDMSASVTESDQLPLLAEAVTEFSSSVEQQHQVGIYAFDGAAELHPIAPFADGPRAAAAGASRLTSFQARDPSTNLHGAIVAAHEQLGRALERGRAPLRFGTLVIFTDGSDRAARVPFADVQRTLDESPYEVFAIGVGTELDEGTLSQVGVNGYVHVNDRSAIKPAFEAISGRILGAMRRYYLLSYCSPARAGTHEVTVEAVRGDDTGTLTYQFDAADFGPTCDPSTPPPFPLGGGARPRRPRRQGGGVRIEIGAQVSASASASATADPESGDQ